jgi:hypothetical protein
MWLICEYAAAHYRNTELLDFLIHKYNLSDSSFVTALFKWAFEYDDAAMFRIAEKMRKAHAYPILGYGLSVVITSAPAVLSEIFANWGTAVLPTQLLRDSIRLAVHYNNIRSFVVLKDNIDKLQEVLRDWRTIARPDTYTYEWCEKNLK